MRGRKTALTAQYAELRAKDHQKLPDQPDRFFKQLPINSLKNTEGDRSF